MCPDNFVGLEKFPKREAYWLTPRLHGESGQILEQTNFLPMRSVFIPNRANSVADCSALCCSKLACFRPASRGNVRRISASFCPDLCKRALREFAHSKYFFVTLCEARRKLRGVKAMYTPALILSPMDRVVWTINRQVVCHSQTIRT